MEERAGEVKEGLRKREAAATEEGPGPMDTDTTKAEWESGVERVKKVGSGVIDTKRGVEGKVKDVKEGGEEKVREGLVSVSCFFFVVGWRFDLTMSEDLGTCTARSGI